MPDRLPSRDESNLEGVAGRRLLGLGPASLQEGPFHLLPKYVSRAAADLGRSRRERLSSGSMKKKDASAARLCAAALMIHCRSSFLTGRVDRT